MLQPWYSQPIDVRACVRACVRVCVRVCVCVLELASVSRLCDMFDIDSYEKLPPCSGEGRIPITL